MATYHRNTVAPAAAANPPTRAWSTEPPPLRAILPANTAKTVRAQRYKEADSTELAELIDMRYEELQARAALADLFGEGLIVYK